MSRLLRNNARDRFPEHNQAYYYEQCLPFVHQVEALLRASEGDAGIPRSCVDMAILPFIRQWSMVHPSAFQVEIFPCLAQWLQRQLTSKLFIYIMQKYPVWQADVEQVYAFGGDGRS